MKLFTLDKKYTIVCDYQNTRNGFKNTATLLKNNTKISSTKINYLNRTWERFEYESVLLKIIDDCFKDKEHKKYTKYIKNL